MKLFKIFVCIEDKKVLFETIFKCILNGNCGYKVKFTMCHYHHYLNIYCRVYKNFQLKISLNFKVILNLRTNNNFINN